MNDRLAATLRGFGPIGILVSLGIVALASWSGVPVLVWAYLSDTDWKDLGLIRPKHWLGTVAAGVTFGALFKILMKTIVMPLLGADPINHAYHYLAGNRAALPGMLFIAIFVGGFSEELVFRGFIFERLGRLPGTGAGPKAAMVILSSALFAIDHYWSQGITGVEQAVFTGVVFGTIFARTGKIWLPMVAHAAFDITAIGMIYLDLETTFAHLVFR